MCEIQVPNFILVALDQETLEFAQKNGINAYLKVIEIPDSQKGTGTNHAGKGRACYDFFLGNIYT